MHVLKNLTQTKTIRYNITKCSIETRFNQPIDIYSHLKNNAYLISPSQATIGCLRPVQFL